MQNKCYLEANLDRRMHKHSSKYYFKFICVPPGQKIFRMIIMNRLPIIYKPIKRKTRFQGREFSGADGSFSYWGVRANRLDLNPTITVRNDGSPRSGTGQLVIDASIGGSIRASGSWR